jgi:RNA polymerase sigma factor (sigma-70 family)
VNQTATGPDRIAAELAADLNAGFAALFEAHQNVLFSTALRICGRWADAEDFTATAFLRAFRALSGYDRERIAALRTRPWLLTILLNAWRNQVRTAARQPREVLDAELPEPEAGGASVEAQAERHETSRELAALLDLLPDRQRVAVVLRHVADLPIAEVASVLGCPPDLPGVGLLTAAMALLVTPLAFGREQGWPAWTWTCLGASVVAFAGFTGFERRRAARGGDPVINWPGRPWPGS